MGDVVLLRSNSVGIDCLVFRDTTRCVEDCGCPLVAFSYTILLLDAFSAFVIISASLCGLLERIGSMLSSQKSRGGPLRLTMK